MGGQKDMRLMTVMIKIMIYRWEHRGAGIYIYISEHTYGNTHMKANICEHPYKSIHMRAYIGESLHSRAHRRKHTYKSTYMKVYIYIYESTSWRAYRGKNELPNWERICNQKK